MEGVHVRLYVQILDTVLRQGFDPDRFPDAGDRCIPHAGRFLGLFAIRIEVCRIWYLSICCATSDMADSEGW